MNVAARVEALTKSVGHFFLITGATRQLLPDDLTLKELPPQKVKGKGQPLQVFAVESAAVRDDTARC